MEKIIVGDKVEGFIKILNPETKSHDKVTFSGEVVKDFSDGSFLVRTTKGDEVLVETYYQEEIIKVIKE